MCIMQFRLGLPRKDSGLIALPRWRNEQMEGTPAVSRYPNPDTAAVLAMRLLRLMARLAEESLVGDFVFAAMMIVTPAVCG